MHIRVNFFNLFSTKTLQNTYIYLWIPAKSPSCDISSTPRKITRHKWAICINDMPKLALTIGSILVTIEHERSDTRLKYRDLPVLQNYLRYLLSCSNPKILLRDLWNRFQFVLFQKLPHFEDNLLLYAVWLSDPQQSFGNPLQAVISHFSSLIRGGLYDASSGFGHLGQNPAGALMMSKVHVTYKAWNTSPKSKHTLRCTNKLSTFTIFLTRFLKLYFRPVPQSGCFCYYKYFAKTELKQVNWSTLEWAKYKCKKRCFMRFSPFLSNKSEPWDGNQHGLDGL